jgi:hypothetical protein
MIQILKTLTMPSAPVGFINSCLKMNDTTMKTERILLETIFALIPVVYLLIERHLRQQPWLGSFLTRSTRQSEGFTLLSIRPIVQSLKNPKRRARFCTLMY